MAVAMQRATQATSIALQFAVPAGGGAWLDQRYGTSPWLLLLGVVLGSYLAFMEVLRLAKSLKQ